ncbi:hypothetical protein F4679DRAFT_560910 [Xylaria curta]|nr:hypothetical protein F4679DRAFT_560910 [Xylaria curta]
MEVFVLPALETLQSMNFKLVLNAVLLSSNRVAAAFSSTVAHVARDGPTPSLPYDPNTTSYCTWWINLTISQSCDTLLSDNLITLDTFRGWARASNLTCNKG